MTRAVGEGVSASLELEGVEDAVMGDAADGEQGFGDGGGSLIRAIRNCRQVAISFGVGLFCGGTQRTALEIMQSTS